MIGSVKEDVNAVYKEIKRFVPHPNFNDQFNKNDIALVKLKEPIAEYTEVIRPACLPESKTQSFDNRVCYATGFGRMNRRLPAGRLVSSDQGQILEGDCCVLNLCMQDSIAGCFASTRSNKW